MKRSYISKKQIEEGEAVKGLELREGIFDLIQSSYSGFTKEEYISLDELNSLRRIYLTRLINEEKGELAAIDRDVIEAVQNNAFLSENITEEVESSLTIGQKIADSVASFGGSWVFIISFFTFIVGWILINVFLLTSNAFDTYPFILLNLLLSCLAAVQAPIIMMSQNRQEQKDRIRAEHDYKINLKAELEIKLLNEKMDHMLINQNRKLLEIQEVQIDYLEDVLKRFKENRSSK